MAKKRHPKDKATNLKVDRMFLRARQLRAKGFPKAKWIEFCEICLEAGYTVHLYEARKTYSKYITVSLDDIRPFKVRFSNHKPIHSRELNGDCDYFVGHTNLRVTNTDGALAATAKYFQLKLLCNKEIH